MIAIAISLLAATPTAYAATPLSIDLGMAGPFAVLAGDGIVDTGPSAIVGDVGTHPRPAVSSRVDSEVTGSVHRASAAAAQAQADLADAYDLAAGARPDTIIAGGALGGSTLPPGVYAAGAVPLNLTGTLTLDGRGDPDAAWILQSSSELATAPGSIVRLVNGARSCDVLWQVSTSATLGSGSSFAGTIVAMTSVTLGGGVTIDGRVLARTARVTLAGDSITVPTCPVTSPPVSSAIGTSGAAPPPSSSIALVSSRGPGDRLPWYVPIVVILSIAAAVVLGEPRRRRSATFDGRW